MGMQHRGGHWRRAGSVGSLFFCAGLAACADNNGTGGPGQPAGDAGDDGSAEASGPRPADAFVSALLSPGAQSTVELCQLGVATSVLTLGSPSSGPPTTVSNGTGQGTGSLVSVTCAVTPSGAGFDVSLSASLAGGSLSITSPAGQGAVSPAGDGHGITASFASTPLGKFSGNGDCVITPTYQSGPVPVTPPVTAGRIFAHVSCPTAQRPDQIIGLMDGGTSPRQCDGEADFLFENCTQ